MNCKGLLRWAALVVSLLWHERVVLAAPARNGEAVTVKRAAAKYVFAHFMVGIVENYGVADWKMDMAYAQSIGIDAFALNCASVDAYTPLQLANAYSAAAEVGFQVFISFDFSYWNNGDTANITAYMNEYASHPAQMQYNGGALVSTFIGDTFDWAPVKAGTAHELFALPNMQYPNEPSYETTDFDGAFSWYAWPTDGGNSIIPGPMTTVWDNQFISSLAGKPYMAPVSAWFSPHFSNKNWVFICEQLITDRWNEMLSLKPELIQIISWNDYGESHYIAPSEPNHSDDGSSQWTVGFPHDGWRIIMKAYIAAYKSGASTPTVTQDQLVYWYRPTPKNTVCTGDPLPAPTGIQYLADDIFVTTMLLNPATLVVTSGNNSPVSISVPAGVVTTNFTMGIGSQYFSVTRNGVTILSGFGGMDIVDSCVYYNFNAYVGSINVTQNSASSTSSSTTTSQQTFSSSSTNSTLYIPSTTSVQTFSSSSTNSTLSIQSTTSLQTLSSSFTNSTLSIPSTTSQQILSSSFTNSTLSIPSTTSEQTFSSTSTSISAKLLASSSWTTSKTNLSTSSQTSTSSITSTSSSINKTSNIVSTSKINSSSSTSKPSSSSTTIKASTSSTSNNISSTSSSSKISSTSSSNNISSTSSSSKISSTSSSKNIGSTSSSSKISSTSSSTNIGSTSSSSKISSTSSSSRISSTSSSTKISSSSSSTSSRKPTSSTATTTPTKLSTTSSTKISSSSTSSTSSSSTPTSSAVCIAGTGIGNQLGLCGFCCNYGYCPAGPCTCTAYGDAIPPPPITGIAGYPLPGEDASYLGLCSFAYNHGYYPSTACTSSAP